MRLRVLPEAEREADEAAHWYETKKPRLGEELTFELLRTFDRLRDAHLDFPELETYRGNQDLRRCRLKRVPYFVVFSRRRRNHRSCGFPCAKEAAFLAESNSGRSIERNAEHSFARDRLQDLPLNRPTDIAKRAECGLMARTPRREA